MTNAEPRTLDVGRLRVLREVALRGSIAAAARSLRLTASAVSQQLSALEREAGTALVDRSPRGVALTGAGLALVNRADEVLDVLAAARADLDRIAGSVAGPVAVAAVASAAASFVCDAARHLRSDHPDIDVRVSVAEPATSLGWLLAGDVDLAVVDEYDYVPLALPDYVVARPLGSEALAVLAPQDWSGPRRPALADLAGRDWVMPPEDAACGVAVRSACRAAGFEPRVRWSSDDLRVLAAAVAAGHGVAVLPLRAIGAAVHSGEPAQADVQVLTLREPRLSRRLLVVGRAATLARPVIGSVVDALADAARAGTFSRGRT
jgi:DNA-binding transcriptional LysR family regulator